MLISPETDINDVRTIVSDLVQTIRENPVARGAIENLAGSLVNSENGSRDAIVTDLELLLSDIDPEVRSVAANVLAGFGKGDDQRVLHEATKGLASTRPDDQVRGLVTLMNMGGPASNSVPALRIFLSRSQRHDLRLDAQRLLEEIDPQYREERAASSAERTASFIQSLRLGEATVDDALIALTDLPQATTAAAAALRTLSQNDFRDDPEYFGGAVTLLRKVAGGDFPVETRIAAAEVYQQLQPTMPLPIYLHSEVARIADEAIAKIPAENRTAAQAAWGGVSHWETARTGSERGFVGGTTVQSANVAGFAQALRDLDKSAYVEFATGMRKVDPNFSHYFPESRPE
jgi:hypothetical protein